MASREWREGGRMSAKMKHLGNCILDDFVQTQLQADQGLTWAGTTDMPLTIRF